MAIIDLGSFNAVDEGSSGQGIKAVINLKYHTVTNSFSWTQTTYRYGSLLPNFSTVYNSIYTNNGGNRGYSDGQIFNESCDGYRKLIFRATNTAPWATVNVERNSVDCGFIVPPPPPPPDPPIPPICDLTVSGESIGISGVNKKDGSITATIDTSVDGNYTITLYRAEDNSQVSNVVVSTENNSYTFTNLSKGNYKLQANSNDYGCISSFENISVADFYFNERFYFKFCEKRFQNREIRISIKKKGYDGDSVLIPNGSADLVKINYPEKGDYMKFKPVLGSECVVNIIDEDLSFLDELEEIYSDQEKMYRIDLLFEEDSELIWSGYILPEQSIHEFKNKPYILSFTASDGLKTLNDVDFDLSGVRMTFLEGIKYCVDKTELSLPFKSMIDVINIDSYNFVLLSGFNVQYFESSNDVEFVFSSGEYTFNGNIITTDELRYNWIRNRTKDKFYLFLNENKTISHSLSSSYRGTLLATILINGNGLQVNRSVNYVNDTIANSTFDALRFINKDSSYTDCYTVLEYLCKQFSSQIKQSGGYWVIENIGAKGRNDLHESAYNNDLTTIYSNEEIELTIDLDCDSENKVLAGGYIENGAAHKKSILTWKLGYPNPIIENWNFESWTDEGRKSVPTGWEITQPPFGQKGAKIERFYDPTTGEISTVEVEDESRRYYFNAFPYIDSHITYGERELRSSRIAVFNQEVINVSFQFIGNAQGGLYCYFMLQLGNLYCTNIKDNGNGRTTPVEPIWQTERRPFLIEIEESRVTDGYVPKFPAYGNDSNISFSLPKAPIQSYFTISIFKYAQTGSGRQDRTDLRNLGFDNFKITKTSPINDAIVKEESIIEVYNDRKFSTVPESFDVFFGDIDNEFRTDGIKDLSGRPTTLWKRRTVFSESDGINNIIAKELLFQYQNTYKILEGDILADDMSIRSILNLPGYELYRFTVLSGSFDLLNSIFSGRIAEVYAEDAPNGGPIGGGGTDGQMPIPNPILVLGFKNNIFTDGNNNIIETNGN